MIPALIIMLAIYRPVTFEARFAIMPSSIDIETYRAAVKAAARPSFCQWNGPDTACRVS